MRPSRCQMDRGRLPPRGTAQSGPPPGPPPRKHLAATLPLPASPLVFYLHTAKWTFSVVCSAKNRSTRTGNTPSTQDPHHSDPALAPNPWQPPICSVICRYSFISAHVLHKWNHTVYNLRDPLPSFVQHHAFETHLRCVYGRSLPLGRRVVFPDVNVPVRFPYHSLTDICIV